MRKDSMPNRDELVVCKITKLHPNSAYAQLMEYNRTGMIHVSEVAKRWVRNIREFVKENQLVVCRVMKVEGDNILLSVKRVHPDQANRKLHEYKKEKKAEKMLELAGKEMGKSLDETYEEVGFDLQENLGSISKALGFALKDPELLRTKGIPDKWVSVLSDIAKKNHVVKKYSVTAGMKIISYRPDGISVIRNALSEAEKRGVTVRYVSAPKYTISAKGTRHKEVREKVAAVADDIAKTVKGAGGIAEYNVSEE